MKSYLHSLIFFFITLFTLLLVGCSSHKDEPASGSTDESEACERVVLVYMAANNSLGVNHYYTDTTIYKTDSLDIDEMLVAAKAGDLRGNRLVVFHSAYDGSQALKEVTASGLKTLKEYSDDLMPISIEGMRRVIGDVRQVAPSEHLGMVLWSHGNGWSNNGYDDPDAPKRTWGEHQSRTMNITSLQAALEGQGLEYVYFDCCYMATVEVAYELRNVTPVIVANASELPRDGMPYDLTVKYLMQGAEAMDEAAATTFGYYNSQPKAAARTCTISVIKTFDLERLARATAAIFDATPLPHPGLYVTNYRGHARQGYSIDFGEYVTALATENGLSSQLIDEFEDALNHVVVYKANTPKLWDDYVIYNHSGLATYVFNSASDYDRNGYPDLQWAADVVQHHLH